MTRASVLLSASRCARFSLLRSSSLCGFSRMVARDSEAAGIDWPGTVDALTALWLELEARGLVLSAIDRIEHITAAQS